MNHSLFKIELLIPSTIEGLNECLNIVDDIKVRFGLDFDTSFSFYTVIVESVENAFIHGNKGIRDLKVRVLIHIKGKEILVEVEDMGDGFDINTIVSPLQISTIKKEGGRGVFFIKELSSSCDTIGKGNIVKIKIKR